jgi:RNA polymerase sigma-70 factor, ECF subfamily
VTSCFDVNLVKSVLQSDREACEQLVRLHYAPIYQLLANLTRNTHLAEDLTQETFASAWVSLGSFAGASSLKTWLHQIAYRKFIDTCRRKGRTPDGEQNGEIQFVESDSSTPLENAAANDEARRLLQAVYCLKSDEQNIIVLHYLQGLSFKEVAEVTGEPAGTIRWRAGLALEKLRQILVDGRERHGSKPRAIS